IYTALGMDDALTAGAIFSHASRKNDFKINLNLASMESDGPETESTPGLFRATRTKNNPMDPGGEDQKRLYRSGLLNLHYKGFSLKGHLFSNETGELYDADQWSLFAEQKLRFHPSVDLSLKLGAQRQTFNKGDDEYTLPVKPWTEISGSIYDYNYDETLLHGGVEMIWKGWDRHRVLLKWSFARSKLEDVSYHPEGGGDSNYPGGGSNYPGGEGIDSTFSPDEPPFPTAPSTGSESTRGEETFKSEQRILHGFTIQDEFRFDDQFTLTAGLRFDHYSDLGSFFSPRIAAVYRLNERKTAARRHILKAQYARAFRPSTFLELLAEPRVDAETIDVYEVGYIYRHFDAVFRGAFFYSQFETRLEEDLQAYNLEPFRAAGGELELEHPIIPRVLDVNANISYVDAENRDTGEEIAGTWRWLGNIALTFRPLPDLSLAAWWRLAVDPAGEASQGEEIQNSAASLDVTMSLYNLGLEGLTLRGGVKNLFNEDMPYSIVQEPQIYGQEGATYFPGQTRRSESWWWVEVLYEF
ncbi:MAG: TonB-dependent receptor, partial [Desulfobacterales bacterium]|nr:TonB-dependent receptor [Desulfobacterales bacterium]